MAQVCDSCPVVPNFMPAIKTMLAASGRAESDFGSSKSPRTVSTPCACSCDSNRGEENRETPITRRETPAISDARFAMRARVGPIFPPTPKMTMSPSRAPSVSVAASVGSLRSSSSSSISRTEVLWRDLAVGCSGFMRISRRAMTVKMSAAIVLEAPRHRLPALSLSVSDFSLRARFLSRQFEWVYNLPEEFGSHALAHYDHGGHPGRIAAEGDRRLESDRGRLEAVSGSQPGRLLCRGRRWPGVRHGNDYLF